MTAYCAIYDTHAEMLSSIQENSSELKQEVRQLLAAHGISQFTMKPVQRGYAFEDPAIPHGQHWMLKVKYPATGSRLPLGLKGGNSLEYLCNIDVLLSPVLHKGTAQHHLVTPAVHLVLVFIPGTQYLV